MLDRWLRNMHKQRLLFVLVNENAFQRDNEDLCLSNWTDEQHKD